MSDPRNPKRPEGPEGDSWAICRGCMRGAPHVRDIRHKKHCRGRALPELTVFTVDDVDMPDALKPEHALKPDTLRRIAEGIRRYRGRL
ncbi:MAG TPA: hypothetical protein VF761_16755 [Gemmatimonadaceae bacterium]